MAGGRRVGAGIRWPVTRARVSLFAAATAIVAVSLVVPAVPVAPAAAAPTLPSGFVLQDVATGMTPPSSTGPGDLLADFTYLPDESILAAGKYGKVQWVPKPGGPGSPRTVASITVNGAGDLGLVSIAVAPDYESSRIVYTARAVPSTAAGSGANGLLRLSAWTVGVDAEGHPVSLGGERTILQTSADAHMHSLGSIITESDGSIWLSNGDGVNNTVNPLSLRALDKNDLHGKVLHLLPDGSGAPDNPYYDPAAPTAPRSLVFADGLRSPFRFSIDPTTGLPILGDVGKSTTEEIDLIRPGYSFGWPCWEGSQPTAGFKDMAACAGVGTTKPVWEYLHNGSGASVTGGVVYTGESYPAAYRGRLFFGDYVDKKIWTLRFDATGALTTAPEPAGFGNGIGMPVRFAAAPGGGDIIYADVETAKLRRLVYAPGNVAPDAEFTSVGDPATHQVSFDASASRDPNGDPLTYTWDFGDGTTGTGVAPVHTYATSPDHFTVTLTVKDTLNASATTSRDVFPGDHPPQLSTTWPDGGLTYAVGEVVHASAVGSDAEDGDLVVTWSSRFEHCYTVTDCHEHYGVGGTGATFDLAMEGHSGDTALWITATVTDSRGASASEQFKVEPRQARVTIESTWPAGFTMDGELASSNLFTEGQDLSISAPALGFDGVSEFDRWSDGSTDRARSFTVPAGGATLGVTFLTPIDRRYADDAALRTRLQAPVGVEQGDLTLRSRDFVKGTVYWTPTTAVHYVAGAIRTRYKARGGPTWCGAPTNDESPTSISGGAFSDFARGCSFYWSSATGARSISGAIRTRWTALGREQSFLGLPTADETKGGYATGAFSVFQGGSIYWSSKSGARWVTGGIRSKYTSLGAERSSLHYPTSDEKATAGGLGRYQTFQAGSIYWSKASGAHPVVGGIRAKWVSLGAESSWLGYPTSDEFSVTVGRRQNFQKGYLVWNRSTGAVVAYRL